MTPEFLLGQYVLVDSLPKKLTPAVCLAQEPRSKLQPKTVGLFRIISMTPNIVTTDEDGIHTTASPYRVTRPWDETDEINEPEKTNIPKMCESPFTRLLRNDVAYEGEYPVERIVMSIGTGDKIRYVVFWYRYKRSDDSSKYPYHIQHHFITQCWCRRHRRW